MFDRPTVIVLGAGASADFGFPLGEKLRDQIISGIGALKKGYESSDFPSLPPTSAQNVGFFKKDPFRALAAYIVRPLARPYLPENLKHEQMARLFEFHDVMKSQTHDTVDRFVWENPRYEFIAKVLISQQIMLGMYDWEEQQLRLKSFSDWEYGERRNWYHKLINLIRDGAQDGQSLANNKLHVVTFNYDHSLEQALGTSLANTEIHHGADYTKAVSILHVNGTPAELPALVTDVGKFILECAQNFHLAQEAAGSEVEEVRINARSAISNAERIYLMGFHFDPSNLSAIGMQEDLSSLQVLQGGLRMERVFCLNFNGHLGLNQKMLRLGIPESRIRTGSPNAPLYINQALDNGFLEQ